MLESLTKTAALATGQQIDALIRVGDEYPDVVNELIEQLRARLRPKPEPAKPAKPEPDAPRSKFEPWLQLARELGVPIEVSQRGV